MKILFVVIFMMVSFKSYGSFYTGNKIYGFCITDKSSATYYQNSATCHGYISGVYDHVLGVTKSGVLCLDSGVTIGQAVKIFMKYADENPSKLNKSAELLVENSMYDAFKCKKN